MRKWQARVYLGETELEDVTWEDETTLKAIVPSGWAPGVYDLFVENSPDEVAFLPGAFEVLPGLDVWTAGTIEGGRIDEIVINPQDPNTVYASSFGIGLFRSRDAGESWQFVLSDGMASNVAIDPFDPDYLYLFAPWQLYRSADAGDTWEPLETEFPQPPDPPENKPGCGSDLWPYPHPTESGIVFAKVCYCDHVGSGLIKSTDHGDNWVYSMEGIVDDPYITAVAFHPDQPDKMVVGTVNGNIYVSTNGGANWKIIEEKPMDHVFLLGFNPHEPHELWVWGDQLIKINSELTEWEEITLPADEQLGDERNPSFYRLHFSPNDPGSVYMILHGVGYKSTDGGGTWVEYGLDGLSFPHDFAESTADVAGNVAVYMGDRYFGIFKTTDDGENWNPKNQGLTAAVPQYLSVSPADPGVVYGSMRETPGIYRGIDYGSKWQFLEAHDRSFRSIAADSFTPNRVFAAGFGTICRSDDWGETWPESECVELPIPDQYNHCADFVEVLRAHPKVEDVLLAGFRHWCDEEWHYADGSIYYTIDGGQSWQQADTPVGMTGVQDLAFDTLDGTIAYAGTTSGFYRSKDTGKTWVRVEGGPDEVGSIAVAPAQDSGQAHKVIVLDAKSGWIMVSYDQGLNWEQVFKPDVMDNTGQLIFTPTDPPTLYAATRTGLRYSPDYGETWFRAPGDLGYVNVIALETVKEEDRVILYASTPGGYAARTDRGMMSATVDGLRDSTTLVNPGVYRYTQTPGEKIFFPLFIH